MEIKTAKPHQKNSKQSGISGISGFLIRYKTFIAFTLICLILSFTTSIFFTLQNAVLILGQISINGILDSGVSFVILAGGFDLSLGSVVALTSVVAAGYAHPDAYALIVPILLGILAGIGIGYLN